MSEDLAYSQLLSFVKKNAFIHDDVLLDQPDDVDEYARHPLILDPPVVVLNSRAGLGSRYMEVLQANGLARSHVICPSGESQSAISNLTNDPNAMAELRDAVQHGRLGISTFYSDRRLSLENIATNVGSNDSPARVSPDPQTFVRLNDKANAFRALAGLGIAVPEAEVVGSQDELNSFRRHFEHGVYLKPSHHHTVFLAHDQPTEELGEIRRDTLVEAAIPGVASSPVTNWVSQLGAKSQVLGSAHQMLDGVDFAGNYCFPGEIPSRVSETLNDWALEVAGSVKGHEGPAGIDSVVTVDGQIFVVDLNLRFNSSTYMFFLRHKLDLLNCFVMLEEVHCNIESFDTLEPILAFPTPSSPGIVAIGPVVVGESVIRFFAFFSAPKRHELLRLRSDFKERLRRLTNAD